MDIGPRNAGGIEPVIEAQVGLRSLAHHQQHTGMRTPVRGSFLKLSHALQENLDMAVVASHAEHQYQNHCRRSTCSNTFADA